MQEDKDPYQNTEDHDDFGLPEVAYSPIEREDDTPPAFEQPTYYADEEEESSKKGWVVAGVIGFFMLIGLAVYLFLFDGVDQVSTWFKDEPQPATTYQEPVAQEPEIIEEPEPEPEVTEPAAPVNAMAPYQGITTISERTQRSYIVIASFVDADMAQDFGQQMADKGIGVKIIQPTNRSPLLHRVAVADYGTFGEAMQQIESFRSEYGEKAWVLKY